MTWSRPVVSWMLDAIFYCTWRDHAGSFAVAIDIVNVHLGLWTSSNSSVASSLADHQPAVQVAVLGWGSCKAHRLAEEEERKKEEKENDETRFSPLPGSSLNVFEQSLCHCRVGATPARISNCLQTRRIHHQVKYRRLNANTCIVAAILFSGHPYIGRHYRAALIIVMPAK